MNYKLPYAGLSVSFVSISPVPKIVPGPSQFPVNECMNDLLSLMVMETERRKPVSKIFRR